MILRVSEVFYPISVWSYLQKPGPQTLSSSETNSNHWHSQNQIIQAIRGDNLSTEMKTLSDEHALDDSSEHKILITSDKEFKLNNK